MIVPCLQKLRVISTDVNLMSHLYGIICREYSIKSTDMRIFNQVAYHYIKVYRKWEFIFD